jgi:diphthamide biosynthesis enzyme Dph1/Dph2-like protein
MQLCLDAVQMATVEELNHRCITVPRQVHYGPASLSTGSSLPTLFVLPSAPLDVPSVISGLQEALADKSASSCEQPTIVVVLEQAYLHYRQSLLQQLEQLKQAQVRASPWRGHEWLCSRVLNVNLATCAGAYHPG